MCYLQLSVPVPLKWIIRKKFECRMHFDLHYLPQLLLLENVLFSSLRLLAPSMCCVSALPSMVAGEKAAVNLGSIPWIWWVIYFSLVGLKAVFWQLVFGVEIFEFVLGVHWAYWMCRHLSSDQPFFLPLFLSLEDSHHENVNKHNGILQSLRFCSFVLILFLSDLYTW